MRQENKQWRELGWKIFIFWLPSFTRQKKSRIIDLKVQMSVHYNLFTQRLDEAYTKELSIYTSYLNPNTTKWAVALQESGRLDTSSIISASLDLEEMGEELETRRNARRGKVMVRLSGKH